MMQNPIPKFIRFNVNPKIQIGNIYLTTKSYLQTVSQQNLARMDVIAIINCEDQEILFRDSQITQLSPKKSRECQETIALEVQGACKLIEETIFQKKKSVMIFGSSMENPFYYSNIYLCCFFIYHRYSFQEPNSQFEIYCRINIKDKKIEINNRPDLKKIPFVLNQMYLFEINEFNGYTFYLDPFSIGEIEKFIKTNFQCQLKQQWQLQQKTGIWLNKKKLEELEFKERLNFLCSVGNSKLFSIENLTSSLEQLKIGVDPIEKYCKNPLPIIEVIKSQIYLPSFIKPGKRTL